MTIVRRPTQTTRVDGGSIQEAGRDCRHHEPTSVQRWDGVPNTAGTVAVVGAGKMGLPLAAQFAHHGWSVVAVDVDQTVVDAINLGQSHVTGEPGLSDKVEAVHDAGRLRATTDATSAASCSDVVVLIVPVMLDDEHQPDHSSMDAAVRAVGPGLRAGATVVFETTLPVGDTRNRYVPMLEVESGLAVEADLFVAFSPERLLSGSVFANLQTYPKLVGGVGTESTQRAARFYASVLDTEVVAMTSAEAAELSKLAETTYRDVNIAYANQLAAYASKVDVDVIEVIEAANSQPYSHIHQPGLGVGGHCIPVYPHFILAKDPEFEMIELSRRINDGQVDKAIAAIREALGGISGVEVLVLGLTYRAGVRELAYSRGIALIERLLASGAKPTAFDPLIGQEETERLGASAWNWGSTTEARAIVVQTDDAMFSALDKSWFPQLSVLIDGRNSLRDVDFDELVRVVGIGVPPRWGS